MQALSINSGLHYRSEFPKPEPGENEALIRLADRELVKSYSINPFHQAGQTGVRKVLLYP